MSSPITSSEVLDVLRRTTDQAWLAGMQSTPDGQAVLAAIAAVAVEASKAMTEQAEAQMISTAPAGRPGVATVTLRRSAFGTTGVIHKGFKFRTYTGIELVVTQDVAVSNPNQATVTLPLATVRKLEMLNGLDDVFAGQIAVGDFVDAILPSDIGMGQLDALLNLVPGCNAELDSAHQLMLGPSAYSAIDTLGLIHTYVAAAQTFVYESSTPIINAVSDWLSILGAERRCYRQDGESDGAYRVRVRNVPDVVSPAAVSQAARGAASHGNLPTLYLGEPFNDGAAVAARQALGLYVIDSLACDDYCDDYLGVPAAAKVPISLVESMSVREGRAYMRATLLGPLRNPDDSMLCADAGAADDQVFGYPDLDEHPAVRAALMGVDRALEDKRAAGVQTDIYVDCARIVHGHGSMTAAVPLPPFALVAGGGKAWAYRHGFDSMTADMPWLPAWARWYVFTFTDLTTWTTPIFRSSASWNLSYDYLADNGFPTMKRISSIMAYVLGNGVASLTLDSVFWMTELTL